MASAALLYSTPPLHLSLSSTSTNHRKYKFHKHTPILLFPFSSKSNLALSHSSPRPDSVQRRFTIRAEPNKGAQSRWNSKSNSDFNSNSNTGETDSRREEMMSFLDQIHIRITGRSVLECKERSMAGQKKQSLEPKSKGKKGLGDVRSSGLLSKFDKLIKNESNKSIAPPQDYKPSRPLSNFDKLIRDDSNKAVAPTHDYKPSKSLSNFDNKAVESPRDFKPSRPTSRFARRSPIPTSNPAKEEAETGPEEQLPSAVFREALKQETSGSDEIPVTMELEKSSELEPELESKSELEAMTLFELRSVAKARGLKGYTKYKKAELVEILKGTSL